MSSVGSASDWQTRVRIDRRDDGLSGDALTKKNSRYSSKSREALLGIVQGLNKSEGHQGRAKVTTLADSSVILGTTITKASRA